MSKRPRNLQELDSEVVNSLKALEAHIATLPDGPEKTSLIGHLERARTGRVELLKAPQYYTGEPYGWIGRKNKK